MEIQRFLFVMWPRYWSVTWLCGWDLLILSHYRAKFDVHRSYETGNIGICNISSNSNSNSNVEVPMPRFTNDPILQSFIRTNLIKTTKLNLELVSSFKTWWKKKSTVSYNLFEKHPVASVPFSWSISFPCWRRKSLALALLLDSLSVAVLL